MTMQLRSPTRRRFTRLGACSAVLFLAAHASAAVKVAPIFGDHMVLQRDRAGRTG